MEGFSHEPNWEFFTLGIPLSQNKCGNSFCGERIDDEIPLKIWINEDWSCGNCSCDIIEIFLGIRCPFKPLLLFQQ
jgi:hypothetical protein